LSEALIVRRIKCPPQHSLMELQMTTTELEAFYDRLDKIRMTPADRALAKVRMAQAEAFAAAVHGAMTALNKLLRRRSGKQLGSVGA